MSSTLQADNHELLVTIPEVISHNPYRMLGIDVSATPTAIRRACDEMLAALQINRSIQHHDYLAFLPKSSITKEAIEQARHTLQDSTQRALCAFFWPVFDYSNADQIRATLLQGNVEEAIAELQLVTAETVGNEYQNAIHDYGLLVFITAQTHPDTQMAHFLYAKAIGILIASSRALIDNSGHQEAAIQILITAIAQRTQLALDRREYAAACQFFGLVDELPFDEKAHEDIATRPFHQLFEQIMQCCTGIRKELDAITDSSPRTTLDEITKRFCDQAFTPIQAVAEHCHYILDELQLACDNLIDCGRAIAILFHNQYDDSQAAHRLFKLLIDLPASEAKTRSIQNDFTFIARHAKAEIASQLMSSGHWNEALQAFQDALALSADDDEHAYIEGEIQRCRRAAAFLIVKQQIPNLSDIWTGIVGAQIRRCLRNALWINLLLTIVSIFGGAYAILSIRHNGSANTTVAISIFMIILCVWTVNNLWAIFCQHQQMARHPIARQLANYGPLEWVIQSIDSDYIQIIDNDYSKVQFLGSAYELTQLWLIRPSFFGLIVIRSADIIWAFKVSTRHSTNGIPTHTSHSVTLCLRNKRSITIECGNSETYSNELLKKMNQLCPWIIRGYSEDLKNKWARYPEQMMHEADERRKYLMPFIDFAYPFVLAQQHHSDLAPLGARMTLSDVIQQKVIPIAAKVGGAICIIGFFWAIFSVPASSNSQVTDSTSSYSPSSTYNVPDTSAGHNSSEASTLQTEIDSDDATLNSWQFKIDTQKNTLDSLRGQIESYKEDIRNIEAANERGEYVDKNRYERLLTEHNRFVRKYNLTRNTHNALVDKYNSLVNKRNEKLGRIKRMSGGN